MKIEIPFNDWSKGRLWANRKTATTRNKRYGNIGDTFSVTFLCGYTKCYELTQIEKVSLGFVRDRFNWEEGCDGEDEFVGIWNEIHPKRKFDDDQKVWLHLFREVSTIKEV